MNEIWKDIEGFEGKYQISNLGNVKSLKRTIIRNNGRLLNLNERILKPAIGGRGYLSVVLCKEDIQRTYTIHKLIANTFIPNYENKPEVNHIDCNTLNNSIDNLEWVTHHENMIHASNNNLISYNLGEDSYSSKLKNEDIIKIRSLNGIVSHSEMAKMFSVDKSQISRIINRKTWKHIT